MKKFQATIQFDMDDDFMSLIPEHREYISSLIQQGVIDQYLVSMESQRVWITFTAEKKEDVEQYLRKSPIHRYWTYDIDELFLIDGQHYRLPVLQMN
jgi:muconolactone delta-isomerase